MARCPRCNSKNIGIFEDGSGNARCIACHFVCHVSLMRDGYGTDDFARWLHSDAAYVGVHKYSVRKPKGLVIEQQFQDEAPEERFCVYCGIKAGLAKSHELCPKNPENSKKK